MFTNSDLAAQVCINNIKLSGILIQQISCCLTIFVECMKDVGMNSKRRLQLFIRIIQNIQYFKIMGFLIGSMSLVYVLGKFKLLYIMYP